MFGFFTFIVYLIVLKVNLAVAILRVTVFMPGYIIKYLQVKTIKSHELLYY